MDDIKVVRFPSIEWMEPKSIEDQILDCIRRHGVVTNKIINASVTGGATQKCQKLLALVESGRVACGKGKDPVTGRIVKAFKLTA
jgi:hypothetical protein